MLIYLKGVDSNPGPSSLDFLLKTNSQEKYYMKRTLIFCCLAVLGLTSCSRLDVAFRWADVYIAGKVDDLFDITSAQKKELKQSIQKDLQVVQAQVLPGWLLKLDEIDKGINADTLNDQKVAELFGSIMTDVDRIKSYFSDTAVWFISTASSSQIAYFKEAYRKKNREDLEKALDEKGLREDYKDKYEDYFKMFLGPLTKFQDKLLEKHLTTASFPAALKAKNNEQLFEKFLVDSHSKEASRSFVKKLYNQPENLDLPEYRQAYAEYQKSLQKLISEVLLSMTPDQKKTLHRRIAEKKSQLARLGG